MQVSGLVLSVSKLYKRGPISEAVKNIIYHLYIIIFVMERRSNFQILA